MLDEIILKPMLTTSEMIEHLKEKNIKFEQMSEKEASKYLEDNNNYFNLTAYKNNFEKKYINKKFVDEYVDLDFAYLKDLSIIDFKLRLLLFDMIVDIEHYLKLKILRLIKNIPNEDGYAVVNKYLDNDYNDPVNPKKLHNSILKKVGNVYYQRIFSKYDIDENKRLEDIPMWEFLEIITFGELVKFYDFFIEEYNLNYLKDEIYIFGHRNPDTDSVTAAITLSYLKNKLGIKAEPMSLGEINKETKEVFDLAYKLGYYTLEAEDEKKIKSALKTLSQELESCCETK